MICMRSIAACLLFAASLGASAQPYPSKPVRIVVPFAPGGIADNSARVITDRLGARLGQSVLVDNRPGASGNIGTELVAKSAPDGYTLLLGYDGTMVVNPHVYAKLPFDTLRDFEPVTKLGDAAVIIVAHPSVPANNVRELIALAKAKPGSLNYGSAGTGSSAHLACELLAQRAGIDMIHVPYKGGGQAIIDVVGGQIPLVCTAIATSQQFLKSGKLKGIGLSSAKRSSATAGRADLRRERLSRTWRCIPGSASSRRRRRRGRSWTACSAKSPRCLRSPRCASATPSSASTR